MKIQIVFLVLVLLNATVLSQDPRYARYENFKNQHIIDEMSVNRCSDVIRDRAITQANNQCKKTNTFILAPADLVVAICEKAGQTYGQRRDLRVSRKPFNIVVCKLTKQDLDGCEYRGQGRTSNIVIACKDRLPVHFEEDIVPTGY